MGENWVNPSGSTSSSGENWVSGGRLTGAVSEPDIASPALGHYVRPQGGIVNPISSIKPELEETLRGVDALGALIQGRTNEAMAHHGPHGEYISGKPLLKPRNPQEWQALGQAAAQSFPPVYYGQKYLRPILHGHPEDIAVEASHHPVNAFLDAIPAMGPIKKLAHMTGAPARIVAGLEQAKRATLPEVAGIEYAKRQLPPFASEQLPHMRNELMAAWDKIPESHKPFLSAALEHTDPEFDYILKHPAVQDFAKVMHKHESGVFHKLRQGGFVGPNTWLKTRVGPAWMAAVARGEEALPKSVASVHELASHHLDEPGVQKALKAYAGKLRNKYGDMAFSYVPVTTRGEMGEYYRRGTARGGAEKAVTAEREAAHLQDATLKGEIVRGLRGKQHTHNVAQNLIRKLDLSLQFLKMNDWLQDQVEVLESLPPKVQKAAAGEFERKLTGLLQAAGIHENQVQAINKLIHMSSQVHGPNWMDDLVHGTLEAVHTLSGEKGKLFPKALQFIPKIYQGVARAQRLIAVSPFVDLTFAPFLYLHAAIIAGVERFNGPRSIMNTAIAAKMAFNPNKSVRDAIYRMLPHGVLEHAHPEEPGVNLLKKLYIKASSVPYTGVNAMRATSYLAAALDEFPKLPKAQQTFLLKAIKAQVDLGLEGEELYALAMAGNSNREALQKWSHKVVHHIRDYYGYYDIKWKGLGAGLHNSVIWLNLINHSVTLSARALVEHPLKQVMFRALVNVVGRMQQQAAQDNHVPEWAAKMGVWKLDTPSPEGTMIVQFHRGLLLPAEGLRTVVNVGHLAENLYAKAKRLLSNSPEPSPEEKEPEAVGLLANMDAQFNFFIAGANLFAYGTWPYGGRPVLPPYRKEVGATYDTAGNKIQQGLPYDLLRTTLKYQAGKLETQEDWANAYSTMPWPDFMDRAIVSAGMGFSPKIYNWTKAMAGQIYNYNPSDWTIPFVPGREYPKVTLTPQDKRGKHLQARIEPRQEFFPANYLPGGGHLAPTQIRVPTPVQEERLVGMKERAAKFARKPAKLSGRKLTVKGALLPSLRAYQAVAGRLSSKASPP